MNRRFRMRTLACTAAALLSACGLFESTRAPEHAGPARAPDQPAKRITQVGFGSHARFVLCEAPTCPVVTPKFLAALAEPLKAAAPTASPVVSAATVLAETVPKTLVDGLDGRESAPDSSAAPSRRLTLHFQTNATQLTAAHKALLGESLGSLQQSELIVISGRTDDVGDEATNKAVALARGLAVRDYLLDLDPTLPPRIAIDARGRCCYVAANGSKAGRARNRRAEVAYGRAGKGAS